MHLLPLRERASGPQRGAAQRAAHKSRLRTARQAPVNWTRSTRRRQSGSPRNTSTGSVGRKTNNHVRRVTTGHPPQEAAAAGHLHQRPAGRDVPLLVPCHPTGRAARQAKQQAELREQQARARRQARPRSAPATRRPSVEERALDTAIAASEPRTTIARPKSAPARRRPPMVPRPTIAELMARQREALSIPRCARLRPPPGSFYRDFVREAPPVGSYEVTYPVKKTTAKGDQSMRYPTGARAPRPSIRKKASDYGYSRTHTNPVDQARALAAEGPGAGAYSLPPTYGVRKSFNRRAGPGGIGAFDLRARF